MNLYVSGWGTLWAGGPYPNELQQVQLPIVPQKVCGELMGSERANYDLCWDVTAGGIDACQVTILLIMTFSLIRSTYLYWSMSMWIK